MDLTQKQTLVQKLALTQTMRQSLQCLQLSAQDLNEFVQEQALSNPLLEIQPGVFFDSLPLSDVVHIEQHSEAAFSGGSADRSGSKLQRGFFAEGKCSLADDLTEQLGQMPLVDGRMRALCEFLIGCLDSRGYLDCPLEELSQESGCTVAELEQALFTVQMLEPCGVGARDLSECLILQLAQSDSFNSLTLAIARKGIPFLAEKKYAALARELGVTQKEVRKAAESIYALNPIPSRGFSDGRDTAYVIPDAELRIDGSSIVVVLNERILPKVTIQSEYLSLAEQAESEEIKQYVKNRLNEANCLVKSIEGRKGTLVRLLSFLAEAQNGFFFGGELAPLTMQLAGKALSLNVSTISRTVQNKYLQFAGKIYPLRDFFSTAVAENSNISSQAIRQRIAYLIEHENRSMPMADEAIRQSMERDGISVSRRAVASYRAALGYPIASRRKIPS